MGFVLIIGIFLSGFLAALLLTKQQKSLSDSILTGFFLLYALNILLSFIEVYNRKNGYPYPAFIHTATPLLLLHGPALWFYIKSLTQQNFQFKYWHLLHFLPFALVLIEHSINFYSLPVQDRIAVVSNDSFTDQFIYGVVVAAIAVSQVGYFAWGLSIIHGYRRKIKTYFSRLKPFDLEWLRQLLIVALVCYGVINALYVTDLAISVASFSMLQIFSYTLGSVYIVVLGFFGLRQGNIFESRKINLNMEEAVKDNFDEKPLEDKEEHFIQCIQEHMKQKKPYLDPDLNLARLSDQLDVTPAYLSKILNNRLSRSFFDFVNHYRVREFKEQCLDHRNKHLSLMGIASNSGFNSKATFNRVFKNITGMTPGEYFRQVSEK